jgi:hypothetical protein
MFTNMVALAVALAASATAFDCNGPYFSFYNRNGNPMSYQTLDPALFPGQEGPHLHSFDGGNGLAASMDFDTAQSSSCTTARIKPDKSLYWRPTLYWNGNNTGFYRVPNKYLKVYYKFGDSGNVHANVTAFPEDFKMMAGNPLKRNDDGDNPGGIKWSCKGANYASIDSVGFPKGFTSCSEGLATEITFPSCWNGNPIDPANPDAHMAWPTAGGTGIDACPTGFKQARFPAIFIEFWYDISAFDGQYSADSVPWVLANGDPTGFGFHADFLNGWEKGVLEKAIAPDDYCNCGCACGNDQMKTCFGADNVNDDQDAVFQSCAASPVYGRDESTPVQRLPGCNPIQSGPALATKATGPDCNAAATTATSSAFNAVSSIASSILAPVSSIVDIVSSVVATPSTPISTVQTSATRTRSRPSSALLSTSLLETQVPSIEGYSGATSALAPTTTALSSSSVAIYTSTSISDGGSLGLVFEDLATATGLCKPAVTITVTPTVTVTVGAVANPTICNNITSTTTVTDVTTVTLPAGYKHKRHGELHKN